MPRYIMIDNGSGYIWGDTADINGWSIDVATPIEACRVLDEHRAEYGRLYEECPRSALASNESGYFVYRADINGSEAVTVIRDGQSREEIDAVERDCDFVTAVRVVNPGD